MASATAIETVAVPRVPAGRGESGLGESEGGRSGAMTAARGKTASRQPGDWIDHPQLSDANAAYLQHRPLQPPTAGHELLARARRLLRQELGYIGNPLFHSSTAAEMIFAEPLGLQCAERPAVRGVRRSGEEANLPVHFRQLCEARLLTQQQEVQLFQRLNFLRYQANLHRSRLDAQQPCAEQVERVERLIALAEWHRDRIVEANVRLVFSIVKKFANAQNAFEDLLSDGLVALMRAVDKFDYDRGFRFSTYATQVVRRNAYRTVVEKQQERQKTFGVLSETDIEISDEGRAPAISEQRWHELRDRLATMLGKLDRREKLIVRARFSLGSHRRVHTLQSLADRLGVSKERVRQLEKRALEKLQAMAGQLALSELAP